jgi:mRNA interferase RelE/StbE
MYELLLRKSAVKELKKIPVNDREKIIDALHILAADPADISLDIKKLVGKLGYRLRVGDWRIIYDKDDVLRIVSIYKVGHRKEIYK